MAEWYEQGQYKPLSMDEAIFWLKNILPVFDEAGIVVTRVGLHSSEGLLSGKELVAGPFHTSMRELAMTEVWWDRLQILTAMEGVEGLWITVHPSQYNFAIGYYGKNRKRLLEVIKNVSFEKDKSLKTSEYRVDFI